MLDALGRELLWWLLWPVDWLACSTLTLVAWGVVWCVMDALDWIEARAARRRWWR